MGIYSEARARAFNHDQASVSRNRTAAKWISRSSSSCVCDCVWSHWLNNFNRELELLQRNPLAESIHHVSFAFSYKNRFRKRWVFVILLKSPSFYRRLIEGNKIRNCELTRPLNSNIKFKFIIGKKLCYLHYQMRKSSFFSPANYSCFVDVCVSGKSTRNEWNVSGESKWREWIFILILYPLKLVENQLISISSQSCTESKSSWSRNSLL